jgi:hypothetical protein
MDRLQNEFAAQAQHEQAVWVQGALAGTILALFGTQVFLPGVLCPFRPESMHCVGYYPRPIPDDKFINLNNLTEEEDINDVIEEVFSPSKTVPVHTITITMPPASTKAPKLAMNEFQPYSFVVAISLFWCVFQVAFLTVRRYFRDAIELYNQNRASKPPVIGENIPVLEALDEQPVIGDNIPVLPAPEGQPVRGDPPRPPLHRRNSDTLGPSPRNSSRLSPIPSLPPLKLRTLSVPQINYSASSRSPITPTVASPTDSSFLDRAPSPVCAIPSRASLRRRNTDTSGLSIRFSSRLSPIPATPPSELRTLPIPQIRYSENVGSPITPPIASPTASNFVDPAPSSAAVEREIDGTALSPVWGPVFGTKPSSPQRSNSPVTTIASPTAPSFLHRAPSPAAAAPEIDDATNADVDDTFIWSEPSSPTLDRAPSPAAAESDVDDAANAGDFDPVFWTGPSAPQRSSSAVTTIHSPSPRVIIPVDMDSEDECLDTTESIDLSHVFPFLSESSDQEDGESCADSESLEEREVPVDIEAHEEIETYVENETDDESEGLQKSDNCEENENRTDSEHYEEGDIHEKHEDFEDSEYREQSELCEGSESHEENEIPEGIEIHDECEILEDSASHEESEVCASEPEMPLETPLEKEKPNFETTLEVFKKLSLKEIPEDETIRNFLALQFKKKEKKPKPNPYKNDKKYQFFSAPVSVASLSTTPAVLPPATVAYNGVQDIPRVNACQRRKEIRKEMMAAQRGRSMGPATRASHGGMGTRSQSTRSAPTGTKRASTTSNSNRGPVDYDLLRKQDKIKAAQEILEAFGPPTETTSQSESVQSESSAIIDAPRLLKTIVDLPRLNPIAAPFEMPSVSGIGTSRFAEEQPSKTSWSWLKLENGLSASRDANEPAASEAGNGRGASRFAGEPGANMAGSRYAGPPQGHRGGYNLGNSRHAGMPTGSRGENNLGGSRYAGQSSPPKRGNNLGASRYATGYTASGRMYKGWGNPRGNMPGQGGNQSEPPHGSNNSGANQQGEPENLC